MAESREAAFFRLEGAIVSRPSAAAAAWFAAHRQHVRGRLWGLGAVAASLPTKWVRGPDATRLAWSVTRGMSEDRLVILAEEYWEGTLSKNLVAVGERLVTECRKAGRRVVLLSEHPDVVARHVAEHVGADVLVAPTLELRDGAATGRLVGPTAGLAPDGAWARAVAAEHGFDLDRSAAYGSSSDDALLLSAIGRPCAVRPDLFLRRAADQHGWPVLDT
jgi:phosphoserine phosphatase